MVTVAATSAAVAAMAPAARRRRDEEEGLTLTPVGDAAWCRDEGCDEIDGEQSFGARANVRFLPIRVLY
ncbi:hypothetical protein GCM10009639_02290 [Kitasatospora putterlickiae]|uniref:Secreted protein n=1 Tax=Kitasatospora putterlickiae TaxID=221725 RepID=A0ABN1XIS3_9ACTN